MIVFNVQLARSRHSVPLALYIPLGETANPIEFLCQDYNCLAFVDRRVDDNDATVPRICTLGILTIIPRREDGKTYEVRAAF